MKILAVSLMAAAVVGLAVMASVAATPASLVGKAAPEIQAAYWINTPGLKLADLKDKIVVVEFWATWCPPCRKSIPHLIELNKKYAGQVTIIGLSDETQDKVAPFVKQMNMDYAVGGGSKTLNAYGVSGIPTVFVIDTTGKIAWQGHPMDDQFEKALDTEVAKLKPATK
jgi:thiol-disulfide isomerase/thioredoxin